MSGFERRRSSKDMSQFDSMTDHTTSSSEVEREALIWLQLLTSGEPKAWDVKGFKRWLSLDPTHRTVFNDVRQRWERLQLPEGAKLAPAKCSGVARQPSSIPKFNPRRRYWLGSAVSLAAVAGVASVYPPLGLWSSLATWGADESTGTGEQRTFALEQHASVTLNTRTSIRRQTVDGQTVGFNLLSGEAAVDLSTSRRPFVVTAGVGRSVAQAGNFEVRNLDDRVHVTCLDGVVTVEHPTGRHTLLARQQTAYNASALSGVTNIEPAQVTAWRNGELVFNQTRLADVITEINRYRPGRVVLMNDEARRRPVNGRFAIASLDLALEQLEQSFGLSAKSLPGHVLILT